MKIFQFLKNVIIFAYIRTNIVIVGLLGPPLAVGLHKTFPFFPPLMGGPAKTLLNLNSTNLD